MVYSRHFQISPRTPKLHFCRYSGGFLYQKQAIEHSVHDRSDRAFAHESINLQVRADTSVDGLGIEHGSYCVDGRQCTLRDENVSPVWKPLLYR
jgi:hypothetical protein